MVGALMPTCVKKEKQDKGNTKGLFGPGRFDVDDTAHHATESVSKLNHVI